MQAQDFNFVDNSRSRSIPVCIYLPDEKSNNEIILFSPGYGVDQYKNYYYLAKYFY